MLAPHLAANWSFATEPDSTPHFVPNPADSGAPHPQSQIRGSKIGLTFPNFWFIDESPSTEIDNTATMVGPRRLQTLKDLN
jgi:hypothetical protein